MTAVVLLGDDLQRLERVDGLRFGRVPSDLTPGFVLLR